MKNERFTVIAGMICLFVLIIAVIVVTIFYMSDEPTWNRPPAVTDAPDAAQSEPWREVLTANLPPG